MGDEVLKLLDRYKSTLQASLIRLGRPTMRQQSSSIESSHSTPGISGGRCRGFGGQAKLKVCL